MDREEREAMELAGLGELSESIRDERGERYDTEVPEHGAQPGGAFSMPNVIVPGPFSLERAAEVLREVEQTPARQGVNPYAITTTFPALPINAQDFVSIDDAANLSPGGDPPLLTADATFVVPAGFNGILRGFRFNASAIFNVPPQTPPFRVTLLVAGSIYRTYELMDLGQTTPGGGAEMFPVYALARAKQTFTLRFTIDSEPVAGYDVIIQSTMFGQLLVDTGRELQFEPANLAPRR